VCDASGGAWNGSWYLSLALASTLNGLTLRAHYGVHVPVKTTNQPTYRFLWQVGAITTRLSISTSKCPYTVGWLVGNTQGRANPMGLIIIQLPVLCVTCAGLIMGTGQPLLIGGCSGVQYGVRQCRTEGCRGT
jgi:hypothetical protein